ncbi:MAG: FRG domain-containing protein [Treponema sp.]|nr:FRG domain-containing protein [Treponema sp.]
MEDKISEEITEIKKAEDAEIAYEFYKKADFTDHISEEMKKQGYTFGCWETFFRGEATALYPNSIAGLFRSDKITLLAKDEYKYLTEILTKCSKYFETDEEMNTFLDKVAKIQHYGGYTRLLDFSHSFLVSLYFACDKHSDKDGCIYRYTTDFLNMAGRAPLEEKKILELYMQYSGESEEDLESFFSRNGFQVSAIEDFISRNHFIELNYSSSRMENQKGLFLYMGENSFKEHKGLKEKPIPINSTNGRGKEYPGLVRKIIVQADAKEEILSYLKTEHSIDKDFIYTTEPKLQWKDELENAIEDINKPYLKKRQGL